MSTSLTCVYFNWHSTRGKSSQAFTAVGEQHHHRYYHHCHNYSSFLLSIQYLAHFSMLSSVLFSLVICSPDKYQITSTVFTSHPSLPLLFILPLIYLLLSSKTWRPVLLYQWATAGGMSLSLPTFFSSSLCFSHHHSFLFFLKPLLVSSFLPLHFCIDRNIWSVRHQVGCSLYLCADCFCPSVHHLLVYSLLFSLHLVCCSHTSLQAKTLLSSLCSSHLYSSSLSFCCLLSFSRTSTHPEYSPVSSSWKPKL